MSGSRRFVGITTGWLSQYLRDGQAVSLKCEGHHVEFPLFRCFVKLIHAVNR